MSAPVLQAMLLADQVYQDRGTGKYVICGIFSAIHFTPRDDAAGKDRAAGSSGRAAESDCAGEAGADCEASPPVPSPVPIARLVRAGSPFAYVSLTELQGTRKFELRYVDLAENNVLFGTAFEVSCRDPLETIQITVPLHRCRFLTKESSCWSCCVRASCSDHTVSWRGHSPSREAFMTCRQKSKPGELGGVSPMALTLLTRSVSEGDHPRGFPLFPSLTLRVSGTK